MILDSISHFDFYNINLYFKHLDSFFYMNKHLDPFNMINFMIENTFSIKIHDSSIWYVDIPCGNIISTQLWLHEFSHQWLTYTQQFSHASLSSSNQHTTLVTGHRGLFSQPQKGSLDQVAELWWFLLHIAISIIMILLSSNIVNTRSKKCHGSKGNLMSYRESIPLSIMVFLVLISLTLKAVTWNAF